MKNKTTTAIQKSRDEFDKELDKVIVYDDVSEMYYPADYSKSISSDGELPKYKGLKQFLKANIATSQKDIFSALIEDLEELKNNDTECVICTNEIDYCDCTRPEIITKAQDIIRLAMEV